MAEAEGMAGETRVPERLPVQPPHDDRGPPGLTQGLAALLQRPASTGGRQTSGRQSALADPLAQAENGSGTGRCLFSGQRLSASRLSRVVNIVRNNYTIFTGPNLFTPKG